MKFYTTSKLSENILETPEGYLVCVGVPIARTGDMVYGSDETPLEPGPDGKVIVHRDPSEVFRPETMASFEGKAVTISHPTEFVTPDNWTSLTKGVIQNVRRGENDDKNDLIADLLITDKVAISLVKAGLREVSCGYEADYIQDGAGKGIQTNIIGNHLALVDEGRAGSAYAINDHKGKGSIMKLKEKIAAIFAKAQDEALKVADAEVPEEKKKEDKVGDEMGSGFDAVMKAVKDLGEKVSALKPKDASTQPTASAPAEIVAKDEDKPVSIEERMKKVEDWMDKYGASLDAMMAKDAAGNEGDVISDEASEEESEDEAGAEDDDFEESTMTGDAASRIEILAPGMKEKGKDAKVKALKAAYATTDGKSIIDQFTAGKEPDFKNEEWVNTMFIAASELLKTKRTSDLSRTRTTDFLSNIGTPSGAMTAEKMNEINAKYYTSKTTH